MQTHTKLIAIYTSLKLTPDFVFKAKKFEISTQKSGIFEVEIRCQESATMQDFAPFTPELLGALSGPQTPGRKVRRPHAVASYFLYLACYFKYF